MMTGRCIFIFLVVVFLIMTAHILVSLSNSVLNIAILAA